MDSKRLHFILWHRLCHTRLKTPIFALVWHTIEDETVQKITPGHLRTPAEPTTMSEPRLAQGKVSKTAQQQHLPTHVEDPHGPRLGHTAARTHDARAGSCGRKGLS